jgi:hypothetical protein
MRMTRRKAITTTVGAVWAGRLGAEPQEARHLAPSASATGDPEFLSFVGRIKDISARKDAKGLLSLMSPVFRVDFDFGKGPAAFSKRWKPQDPASELWRVLDRMLALPARRYDETLYVVPYVYGSFPIDLDPLSHVVTIGESVAIREAAELTAKEVVKLNHAIIPTAEKLSVPVRLDKQEWLKVVPSAEAVGYVRSSDVYSPAEYRGFFEKQGGKWRWLSLVCAD